MAVKFFRSQLKKMQSLTKDESIDAERKLQELVGALMQKLHGPGVRFQNVELENCSAAIALPPKQTCTGAVLYLHGGGYCCGNLEYAKGFGSVVAAEVGVNVLCPAYRLAPEDRFPAALQDAMSAYLRLLQSCPAEKIVLAGESAGGGLVYALCLEAKKEGLPLPGGIVAMSPWTDLTASGESYTENAEIDPSLTLARLRRFADCYTEDFRNPMVSPLFGDLTGLPESLLFTGGDEIMRDDTVLLHGRLLAAGCKSTLTVAPGLWHAYVLYGMKERKCDMDAITAFVRRITE